MAKITPTRGKAGLYRRSLVPSKVRQKTIQRISGIPEAKRSSDHWWELGETVALNGLLKQDESLVQEGMKHLKKATQMDPPSVSALMDLGWLLMYRQMELFALEYFEQAAKLSSTSRDLYSLLAICHARLGNREEALAAVTRATMSPEAVALDFELQAVLEDKNTDRFVEHARNIHFLKISPEEALAAGFPVEEIFEVVRMINSMLSGGDDSVGAIESLAEIDYIAKDYAGARARLERIVISGEATAKSYVTLGLMAFKEGDEDDSLANYQKALELDDDNFLANVSYTSIKGTRQEYTQDVVRRMVWAVENQDEDDPRTSAVAMSNLGNYFAINGEFEHDIELQESSLRLYSDDSSVTPLNLFATLLALGKVNKAGSILEKYRKNFKNHGFYKLAKPLLKTFKAMKKDPMLSLEIGYRILNDEMPSFNQQSLIPLVCQTLKNSKAVPPDHREDFYKNLGYLANAVDCRDVSAECWKRLGVSTGDQTYFMNYAMDLSASGQAEHAIQVLNDLDDSVKALNERTCSMSAVIYSQAEDPYKAREMLEKGFEFDADFSLLYSNYIGLARVEKLADQKEQMLLHAESLIPADTSNANLQYHLACIKTALGDVISAADLISACFFDDSVPLNANKMRQKDARKDETDVSDLFDMPAYKVAAQILYRAGRIEQCQRLLELMRDEPSLADGDSLVGLQSVARRSPGQTPDLEVLDGMGDQVPVLIEKAIGAIEHQDISTAQTILEKFAQLTQDGIDLSDFNHLEGNPQALIETLRAQCKHAMGHSKEALEHLQTAVKIDDQVPYVYETFIDVGGQDNPSLAFKIAPMVEMRLKGSPWIRLRELSAAFELSDYAKASELIKSHKAQFTALLPAGRYQSYLEAILLGSDISPKEVPEWIQTLQVPHKTWLAKAYQLLVSGHEEASVIYLMKWFEDAVNRWFDHFKSRHQTACHFIRETPFSAFIEGSRDKMNLGAMVKTLSIGIRPSAGESPEQLLVAYLRKQSSGLNQIMNWDGIARLRSVGELRNCLMHTTPVEPDEIHRIREWLMLDNGELGEIAELFTEKS